MSRNRYLLLVPLFCVVLGSVVSDPHSGELRAQGNLKPPAFDKKQLDAADALIKEVFHEEFAQAKEKKEVREQLARTLLEQSKKIFDEANVRYMALTIATQLAAEAGDQPLAFEAIDELAKHHEIDVVKLRGDALATVIKLTEDPAAAKNLAKLALDSANDLALQDQLDQAVRLALLAETAAKKAGDAPYLKTVSLRAAELQAALKETQHIQPFLAKLKKDPADPEANQAVGASWCFGRDKWEKGLPYLAKGSDAALKALAAKDLAAPLQPKSQAELGQAWWDVAQKNEGQTKLQMLRRSYQWYMRAVFQLDGDAKTQVQGKLKELTQILPAKLRVTEIDGELKKLTGHTGEVLTVAFAPSGVQAASGSEDKTVRLWDLITGKAVQTFTGHTGTVYSVAFAPNGKHLYSCSEDKTIREWDTETGKEIKQFTGPDDFLYRVAVSPDGKWLAGAGHDGIVYLWDIANPAKAQQLAGHGNPVMRVIFSPDSQLLASVGEDKKARVWDVKTAKQVKELSGHTGFVVGVAFSPDGKKLLTSGTDDTSRLWDIDAEKEIQRYTGHSSVVGSVAFSPDGSRVVTGSDDRLIIIWDTESGQQIHKLEGHKDAIFEIAYSPDGRWLLSGSLDKTVRLWGERK